MNKKSTNCSLNSRTFFLFYGRYDQLKKRINDAIYGLAVTQRGEATVMEPSIKVLTEHVQYGDARVVFYSTPQNSYHSDLYFHSHYSWELHFSAAKRKLYMLESGKLEVGKNELLIINPGVIHGALRDLDGTHVLKLNLQKVPGERGFYKCFNEMLESAALKALPVSESLIQKVKEFVYLPDVKSVMDYCRQKLLMEAIVFELFESIGMPLFEQTEVAVQDTEGNTELILEHMLDDPTVEMREIADAIGYSVRHTARLIEKTYQMSLVENRRWKTLKNASYLLKKGQLPPEEIALHSGFESAEALYQQLEKYEQLMLGKKYQNSAENEEEQ